MADDTTKEALNWAVAGVGGLGGLGLLGVFVRGLLTGTVIQEKEVRDELRVEVSRLRDEQIRQQGEIDSLRTSVRQLTSTNLYLISSRADARALVKTLERELGRTFTEWPADPGTGGP